MANIIDYVRGADGVLMLSSMNAADALALALAAGVDWTRLDSSASIVLSPDMAAPPHAAHTPGMWRLFSARF